jgi:hypothetical protein
LARKYGWKNHKGVGRPAAAPPEEIPIRLSIAKKIYTTEDHTLKDIERMLDIPYPILKAARDEEGWERSEGYKERLWKRKHAASEVDNTPWPKVTAEWPEDQRFDTPGRHYHSLDRRRVWATV